MQLKNVSFEPLIAVKEDTKSTEFFQPQEVKTVTEAEAKWFMERYNMDKVYFAVVEDKSTVEPVETEEEPVEPEKFICNVCSKECDSLAGLKSHMRTHVNA